MSGALLVIQAEGATAPRLPTYLSPIASCLVSTFSSRRLIQAPNKQNHSPSHNPEPVWGPCRANIKLYLSQPLSASEADSLPPFLLGLIHTQQIQDVLIAQSHPLLSAVLALSLPDNLRIWIAVDSAFAKDLAPFPPHPAAFWLCDAIEQAEYLLLQGLPISQIIYPPSQPVCAPEDVNRLAGLDAYLRGKAWPSSEQNLAFAQESLSSLGPYLLPKTETDTELESESTCFCLIQIEPDSDAWKPTLASFIQHYQLNPAMALVLLPPLQIGQDAVALLYDQLLAWFDAEQIDSEQTPEMIVLDPAELKAWIHFPSPPVFLAHSDTERNLQACLQVLRDGGVVVALSEALTQKLNPIQMGTTHVPAMAEAIFKPWLAHLSGATFYAPEPAAFYLWNQHLLESAWKCLNTGQ